MNRTPEAEAFTELVLAVFRFWSSLHRHGRAITKRFGETPARWQVLGGIWDEPRTVPQIARSMGLTRQSVQRVADALMKEELAVFLPNPDHKRSPRLRLTERGRVTIEAIDTEQIRWSNRIATGMKLKDLQLSVRTVDRLTAVLDGTEP